MLYFSNLSGTVATTQTTKSKVNYPLSVSEVKRHLRLDSDFVDDDDYINTLIIVATQYCENYIGKDIAYTLNTLRIDDWDGDFLKVYDANFLSATTSHGTILQTSTHYDYFQVEFTESVSADPLTLTYYTGYATTSTTPELIKQAILVKIADLYDNERSSYGYGGSRYNTVIEMLLSGYVNIRFV
jgi:hypothetical protein